MSEYPSEAFVNDVPWWELERWPGTRRALGDEPRIAAWLAYNKSVGETFTTDELREILGHRLSRTSRNDREHFQRRIRELRSHRDGWVFPSTKHDRNVDSGSYRLDRIGWHPALGSRPKDDTKVSTKLRREVIERDHYRCFHCGVISGEPYPDAPELNAVMTVGHIRPREFGGKAIASNLRAECSLCNESVRSATSPPESLRSVQASVNNLNAADRRRLREWVSARHRVRDRVDEVYDRFRLLTIDDQAELSEWLVRTS
ncbi:HNH endonuclease [Microbacterium testaceum]|uniref:HNH endonuclease n=1 Tax=Microbacterium testaceum TaxID=2033 RepID=UPI000734D11B|nr:HNH endonuclease [Microbacterium testaceum]